MRGNEGTLLSKSVTVGITNYRESTFSTSLAHEIAATISTELEFGTASGSVEVSSSVASTVSHSALSALTMDVTTTVEMSCDIDKGYVALYRWMINVDESLLDTTDQFHVNSASYWCTTSGQIPKCPYEYCVQATDCQNCTEDITGMLICFCMTI